MVYESRKSVIPALIQYNLDGAAPVCQWGEHHLQPAGPAPNSPRL